MPVRVKTVVVAAQHDPDVRVERLRSEIVEAVILPTIPAELRTTDPIMHVNATGRFVTGGPMGDAGLTGRKIIVDSYGGMARHGGGAFSGKDPTKVDRSAAYAARWVAKNVVAAGLADRFEVEVAYGIGIARPVSLSVESFGTGKVPDARLQRLVERTFDLRPASIIAALDLRRPIYRQTAAYGHFGRPDLDLPWERTDKAALLASEAGLPAPSEVRPGSRPAERLDGGVHGLLVLGGVAAADPDRADQDPVALERHAAGEHDRPPAGHRVVAVELRPGLDERREVARRHPVDEGGERLVPGEGDAHEVGGVHALEGHELVARSPRPRSSSPRRASGRSSWTAAIDRLGGGQGQAGRLRGGRAAPRIHVVDREAIHPRVLGQSSATIEVIDPPRPPDRRRVPDQQELADEEHPDGEREDHRGDGVGRRRVTPRLTWPKMYSGRVVDPGPVTNVVMT